jgi:hypothetical protein
MGFFTNNFMTDGSYSAAVSTSAQGQLSSSYTNALSSELSSASVADYIAYLYFTGPNGGDVDAALALKAQILSGSFTLTDLFGAAQSKTAAVPGASIADPEPKMVIGNVTIDLKGILGGLDTESWKDSGKTGQYHTREFYTSTHEPTGYDADWSVVNVAPDVKPITASFDETTSVGGIHGGAEDLKEVNLLDPAHVSDSDGDELNVADVEVSAEAGTFGKLTSDDIAHFVDSIHLDEDTGVLTFDVNSAYINNLLEGETLVLNVTYNVDDGNGHVVANTAHIEINGTADKYSDSATYTFLKTDSSPVETAVTTGLPVGVDSLSEGGRSFVVDLGIDDGFDFSGTLTLKAHADLDAKNESIVVTVDSQEVWSLTGNLNSNQENDNLVDYTKTVTLTDANLSDGQIIVDGEFSQNVAKNSTIQVDLDYSYWA